MNIASLIWFLCDLNIDTAYHTSSAGSKRGGQPLTGFKGPQVEAMRKLKRKPSLLMDQVWYYHIRKLGGNIDVLSK